MLRALNRAVGVNKGGGEENSFRGRIFAVLLVGAVVASFRVAVTGAFLHELKNAWKKGVAWRGNRSAGKASNALLCSFCRTDYSGFLGTW